MSKPVSAVEFARAASITTDVAPGLPPAIDVVAAAAAASHRFLRHCWFAAALTAYGGDARTLVVSEGVRPIVALPLVGFGPRWLRAAAVPGSYWPFRSFPSAEHAGEAAFAAALDTLAKALSVLRVGPVYDDDASVMPLLAAARAKGWATLDRLVADSYLLDIAAQQADGGWPRGSTLRKNRFHEKHLAAHGALDWRFVSGTDWDATAFDDLAQVERASWIAARTDGSDAKFTQAGHGAFWRAAAADPVLAGMLWAAVLRIDGKPAAFSFDLNAGSLKYAIANSYDPAFAKHSPGKLLYYRNLVRGMADGITRVDWGAGDSGYKRVIGAEQGPAIRDWLLVRPGLAAGAARLVWALWRGGGRGAAD